LLEIKKANKKLQFVQCQDCKFVFNFPKPDDKWISWFYSSKNPAAKGFESNQPAVTPEDLNLWKRRLNSILKYKTNGRFLDIGCGKGILLHLAWQKGFDVYGTEYSKGEIDYCETRFHLKNIFQGELDNKFKENFFDIITLFHVLEHIIDFRLYLKKIKSLLKKEGLLVIEVPNKDWIVRKSYTEKLMPHQIHHNHFSAENLKDLLTQEDFQVIGFGYDNPFHLKLLNKWTAISLINKLLFKFGYYNFSPVIKIYAEKNNEN